MRYYEIKLSDEQGNPLTPPSLRGTGGASRALTPGLITSLLPSGEVNPAALNIELDVHQVAAHTGDTASYVRIWGLGLQDISRAFDLNGKTIRLRVGMSKGYPLADPSQQGTIVEGSIFQAFGNWVGTDMTVDMMLGPPVGTPEAPLNFAFKWSKGEPLSALLSRVLGDALDDANRGLKQTVKVSDNRVAPADLDGIYTSLPQFAQWLRRNTFHKLGPNDDGVHLRIDGQEVSAYESTSGLGTGIKEIRFQDLLGQVTWYAARSITAKLVMRGDLVIGQAIRFPNSLVSTVQAGSNPAFGGTKRDQDSLGFSSATFMITQIHHWGNFRQADAMSWNTTVWAVDQSDSGAAGPASPSPTQSFPPGVGNSQGFG